jgi:hypothetical protein
MTGSVKGFIDKLDKVKHKFSWEVQNNHRFKQIVGYQLNDRFCPMSAVLCDKNSEYELPEHFMSIGSRLNLQVRDIHTIVDSCDGHGDKYDAYVRHVIFHTLFGRREG